MLVAGNHEKYNTNKLNNVSCFMGDPRQGKYFDMKIQHMKLLQHPDIMKHASTSYVGINRNGPVTRVLKQKQ